VGHDVAPVAGGVADGEEDGPIEALGLGEGVFAPGVPVDGVVGVLQEVGAGLGREAVGHSTILAHSCRRRWPAIDKASRYCQYVDD